MSESLAVLWKGTMHSQVRRTSIILAVLMLILLFSAWLLSNAVYAATTVTVNDVGDAGDLLQGDGVCDADNAAGEQCTLRAAIEELNAQGADSVPHEIHFNIPGSGPHTIAPTSDLPMINVPLIIDGRSQPNSTCPTADQPANLQIVLDGANNTEIGSRGFWVNASGSTITGLVIGNFSTGIWLTTNDNRVECSHIGVGVDGLTPMPNSKGIQVTSSGNNTIGGTDDHAQRNVISANTSLGLDVGVAPGTGEGSVIANNYIGTTADGLIPLGNESGVLLQQPGGSGVGSVLGGTEPLARNVIGGNERYGVQILAGQNHQVLGNFIGVGADGVTAVPNLWDGIFLFSQSTDNIIGGIAPDEANLIAHNGDSGIAIFDLSNVTGNTLRGNVLFDNGNPGIDIGLDGVDENDGLDVDEGGNGRLNYPILTTVTAAGQIVGSYSGAANQTFTLDFYSSETCHKLGNGEAEVYLGSTAVTTDGNGNANFDVTLSGALTLGHSVSATATDADGSTSEFSACAFVGGAPPPPSLPFITDCVGEATPPFVGSEFVYLPLIVSGNNGQSVVETATSASDLGRRSVQAVGPTAANSLLADGGVVTGVDGVSIGAIAGTLPTAIDVTIAATAAPSQTIITDPTVHGSYYHISADQKVVICNQEKGFILGLPLPDGVSNENIAVAILPSGSDGWLISNGSYDSDSELILTSLSGLTVEGATVVLIETTEIAFVAVDINNGQQGDPLTNSTYQPEGPIQRTETASCATLPSVCDEIVEFFRLVLTEMTDMGYPPPYIRCDPKSIRLNPPEEICEDNAFLVRVNFDTIADCTDGGEPLGAYLRFLSWNQDNGSRGHLLVCPTNLSQLFNVDKRAIRYHYFQATQFGLEHDRTWLDWLNEDVRYDYNDWVLASTAAAAMISVPTVMESTNDYARRPVDVPLASDEQDYKYRAQDFWVYIGKSLDEGLTMLEPLFEQHGATTNAVVEWAGGMDNFQDLYWNWAQNQVMLEDGILLNDDDTGTACTFQENSVETLLSAQYSAGTIIYHSSVLPPLTTVVYQFTIDSDLFPAVIWAGDSSFRDEVRSKIYVNGEDGCELIEDENGSRHFTEEEWAEVIANGSEVYIVVSNTDPEEEREVRISVEAGPFVPPTP